MRLRGLTTDMKLSFHAGQLFGVAEGCMVDARNAYSKESARNFVVIARRARRQAFKILRDLREPWPELQEQIERQLREISSSH